MLRGGNEIPPLPPGVRQGIHFPCITEIPTVHRAGHETPRALACQEGPFCADIETGVSLYASNLDDTLRVSFEWRIGVQGG